MPVSPGPAAFMSYVREDDAHENERLTRLREQLEGEVRMQSGQPFPIFQDRNDIAWGDNWKTRIEEGIDAVTFLLPIVTPSFFQSAACRDEYERFRKRERKLKRTDLILPLYYVEADEFSDEDAREADAMAKELLTRQYADWRELRFEPLTSATVGRTIAAMAKQVKVVLSRAPGLTTRPASQRNSTAVTWPMDALEEENERGQPVHQTEPHTVVVDAMHRGDYPTITAAIAAEPAGTRILVRPGYYPEGIVMNKPLEILGDGPVEDIIIVATRHRALLFQTTMGRVANLTLRQKGRGLGMGSWYGVDITQGRLYIEGCDISSESRACIAVRGNADPVVRGNRIHDGKGSGVVVYDNGRGLFEDNDISGNAYTAFDVRGGCDPVVRSNRIHDGKHVGVAVSGDGRGLFEDNDVSGNALMGLGVRTGGDPIVRGNRITANDAHGVVIFDQGRGRYERNHLWDNGCGAWHIGDDAGEVIREGNVEAAPGLASG